MAIRISDRLSLVIPLYDAADQIYAYVHSAPISREVFEANFLILSKTFAAIHGDGLGSIAGPRVAALLMKEVAKRMGGDDADAIAAPLMNEIRRLTNVLAATPTGWETIPFTEAVTRRIVDADDLSEVENALVFFTAESSMLRRQVLTDILEGACKLWGAQTTSLNSTAFAASLSISTTTATLPATQTAAAPAAPVQRPARTGAMVLVEGRIGTALPI